MAAVDRLVQEFLSKQRIAVVGVSDRRETGCNSIYRKFKEAGYRVTAVNPRLTAFDGDPCYPDLAAIPEVPEAVFILAKPAVTEQIVQQCVALGVRHVWMHCMMGTRPGLAASSTSVSPAAVRLCQEHGVTVIPGTCPNQFLKPDSAHGLMRQVWRLLGFLNLP